eukprot:scaffold193_cov157-Skeletonema_menzelii.AAC.10
MKIALLLLVSIRSTFATSEPMRCACLFDGNDVDNCAVYGVLGDRLKGFPKAEQACLDAYQIKKDAPDPFIMCSSANSFVNALKNGPLQNSGVKFGLGVPYGVFWEESPSNADLPVLKDSIEIDGTAYDCNASQSNCYNAMKPYFESDPIGQKEMQDVCEQMENEVRNARELEQSILRVRICSEYRESAVIETECTSMFNEMESDLESYASLNCGGFGVGSGTRELPSCGEVLSQPSSEASSATKLARLEILAYFLIAFGFLH